MAHDPTRAITLGLGNEYKDGKGLSYSESLRRLSWAVPSDVPAIGQNSSVTQMPTLRKAHGLTNGTIYIHPTEYLKMRHTDHMSFAKSQRGSIGILKLGNPSNTNVYERLYTGSKSMARLGQRAAQGKHELAADVAFKNGVPVDAVPLYTQAIEQAGEVTPNIFAYEKRCACYAELGRYREALQDAEHILRISLPAERGSALMRVKAIKDYIKRMDSFDNGYHHATSTLVCLLRPREHRQLVQSHPSSYGRPKSAGEFGKGLSASASAGALLSWDKDGDGSIDMDEFRRGLGSLGFKAHSKEKMVFQGGGYQRGVI